MGNWIELTSADGHRFSAWQELPDGAPLGTVIVLQEIFGVNAHIRDVCSQYAANGFQALAPRLFERVGSSDEFSYDQAGIDAGRALIAALSWDHALADVEACAAYARSAGQVGTVGFCWGGSLAWLCSTRLTLPSVSYYGARSLPFIDEMPLAPIILHFGAEDTLIPESFRQQFAARHPNVPQHLYAAGHGFNCNERADFHPSSAAMAWRRSLAFFRKQLIRHDEFVLHPQLQADAMEALDLELSRVLLMNDTRFPWLILVPRVADATELIDLLPAQQTRLMHEIALVSAVMRDLFEPDKLNVATIGNIVPQLHVHVVARSRMDSLWPAPVWGQGAALPYEMEQAQVTLEALRLSLQKL